MSARNGLRQGVSLQGTGRPAQFLCPASVGRRTGDGKSTGFCRLLSLWGMWLNIGGDERVDKTATESHAGVLRYYVDIIDRPRCSRKQWRRAQKFPWRYPLYWGRVTLHSNAGARRRSVPDSYHNFPEWSLVEAVVCRQRIFEWKDAVDDGMQLEFLKRSDHMLKGLAGTR